MAQPGEKLNFMPDEAAVIDAPNLAGLSDLQVVDQFVSRGEAAHAANTAVDDNLDVDLDQTLDEAIKDETKDAPLVPKVGDEPAKQVDKEAVEAKDKVVEPEPVAALEDGEDEDDADRLTIAGLNKLVKGSPELKAALDKDPSLQRKLFYNARKAERAGQYDELFQTPAMAKAAKEAADDAFELQQVYESPDPGDTAKFFNKLIFGSYEKDGEGRVKLGANGQPISTGAYERVMGTYRSAFYGTVETFGKQLAAQGANMNGVSGEDIQEAIRIIKMVANDGEPGQVNKTPAAAQDEGLPENVRKQLTDMQAKIDGFEQQRTKSGSQFAAEAVGKVTAAIESDVRNLLAKRLPKDAALSDYIKDNVVRDVVAEVERLANTNSAHKALTERMLKVVPRDDEGIKKVIEFKRAFTKELIPRTLSKVMSKATQSVLEQHNNTVRKVTDQANRKEVQASGVGSTPSRQDAKQIGHDVIQEAEAKGQRLSDMDVMNQVTERVHAAKR